MNNMSFKVNWFFYFICIQLIGFSMVTLSCERKIEKATATNDYQDLIILFREFREFQNPTLVNGIPDFTERVMNEQYEGLKVLQNKLSKIDTTGWSIPNQVDYHLVRAEMNGLDFHHRVLRPWSRDPCFYSIRPGMTDPFDVEGVLPEPESFPLSENDFQTLEIKLENVLKIYAQAEKNLTNAAGDLARLAIHFTMEDVQLLNDLEDRLKTYHPGLVTHAEKARGAVEHYLQWLIDNKDSMTEPAGLGIENYNWWLKYVHLVPYTWDEIVNAVHMEDNRLYTFLKLEQNQNRNLPEMNPVTSPQEYHDNVRAAVDHLMEFLEEEETFTVQDNLDIEKYWSARKSSFRLGSDALGVLDYFSYYVHREPVPHEAHEGLGHDFEWQRLDNDDREIRGTRRLYFIEWIRDEGWAFALEELLMHAGVLNNRPVRGKEIVYEQAIFRNCRALSDLRMHSRELNLDQAMQFCVDCAPHGELLDDSHHLWYEMRTTLRIPGWHMGMVLGKIQIMKLFRDRAKQLGDEFKLNQFLDDFLATGFIPISLVRWEMTGLDDEIKELVQ